MVVVFKPLGKCWETSLFVGRCKAIGVKLFFVFFLFEALVVERCLVVSPQKIKTFMILLTTCRLHSCSRCQLEKVLRVTEKFAKP